MLESVKLQDNVTLEPSSAKTLVLFGFMTFPKTAAEKEKVTFLSFSSFNNQPNNQPNKHTYRLRYRTE